MTGDLLINNKDAYTMWGVNMGDGFRMWPLQLRLLWLSIWLTGLAFQ